MGHAALAVFAFAVLALAVTPALAVDVEALLRSRPDRFGDVLEQAETLRLQVLLAEVVETDAGRLRLSRSSFGDLDQYFYPASAIKTCAAVATLVELNRLNRLEGTALGLDTQLVIHPLFEGDDVQREDESNPPGRRITVGHEIRKLSIVSDNAAYNRLYELVGHRELDTCMRAAGFPEIRIEHRLSEFRSPEDQRRTRPVTLLVGGRPVRRITARTSDLVRPPAATPDRMVGRAHVRRGELVDRPFDFGLKNAASLVGLQDLLVAIVRPEIDTGRRGFPELTVEQRRFLVEAMTQLPRESSSPRYDPASYPDAYAKFLLPGLARVVPAEHLLVANKVGQAYGFSIENAYVEDRRTGRCFFVAAVIHTNPNGVINDGVYAYETVAEPFFAALGETLAETLLGEGTKAR